MHKKKRDHHFLTKFDLIISFSWYKDQHYNSYNNSTSTGSSYLMLISLNVSKYTGRCVALSMTLKPCRIIQRLQTRLPPHMDVSQIPNKPFPFPARTKKHTNTHKYTTSGISVSHQHTKIMPSTTPLHWRFANLWWASNSSRSAHNKCCGTSHYCQDDPDREVALPPVT